ncbi:YscQ/HrcQ family type III secretion apparatus protein [Escherichia coli]|nr:YscQ/HrcQ family type III secretion apparatus protein [Escherichia coli]
MFGLRKVNGNTHSFETTFQNWKENGEDVALLMPEFSAKWLPIAEESGSWSGWVLLRELFPLISAELAGMALMPETERLIVEWLSLSSTPLNLKYPELKYNRLCVGKVFDGVLSPAQPLIRIWTGELNIWLDKVTVCQYENAPTLDKKSLYWPIHFVIGFSKTKICDLIYPEELKMVDHFEYEEDFETDDFDIKKSEIEINDENDYQQINSFEDLPVKIEFVLGKKIMNLYEIDDLCAKRIISLLPEAEKNIEIRVNGALTGYGELVEVDDKLGVEIHSWLSGNNNVK